MTKTVYVGEVITGKMRQQKMSALVKVSLER